MESTNQKAGRTIAPAYYRKDTKSIKRQLEREIFNSEIDTYKAHKKASQTKVLLKAGKAQTAGIVETSNGTQYYAVSHGVKSVKITGKAKQAAQNSAQKMPEKFMRQAQTARIEELKNKFFALSSRQKKKLGFKNLEEYIQANI